MKARSPEPQPRPASPSMASPADALMERLITLAIEWQATQSAEQPAASDAASSRQAA